MNSSHVFVFVGLLLLVAGCGWQDDSGQLEANTNSAAPVDNSCTGSRQYVSANPPAGSSFFPGPAPDIAPELALASVSHEAVRVPLEQTDRLQSLAGKQFIKGRKELEANGFSATEVDASTNFSFLKGGNSVTDPTLYPWSVVLVYEGPNVVAGFCSGSLVAPNWVLTAAHCADAVTVDSRVFVGGINTTTNKGTPRDVDGYVMHECYDAAKNEHDLALLKLEHGVAKQPLGLAAADTTIDMPVRDVKILGWGESNNQFDVVQLQALDTTLVALDVCKGQYGIQFADTILCAGKTSATTCEGDSGGPLMTLDQNNKFQEIGIAVFNSGGCLKPGGFTRVSSYAEWIAEVMTDF